MALAPAPRRQREATQKPRCESKTFTPPFVGLNTLSIFQPIGQGARQKDVATIPRRLSTCLDSLRRQGGDERRKDTMGERVGAMARLDEAILAFELSTIVALQFLVIVMIFASTAVLFVLSYQSLRSQVVHISTVKDLLSTVQRTIAGVLIVVLGLEVLETLKAYFRDHHVRLEVIIVVAIIAASRHLVQVDFEHASPLSLLGLSAVIVSLTLGYFLVKKALHAFPSKLSDNDPHN
jgi:uncharacterized membrane protein (DUF373 family)